MTYYMNVYDLKPQFNQGYAWPSKTEAESAANLLCMRDYAKLLYRIHVRLK